MIRFAQISILATLLSLMMPQWAVAQACANPLAIVSSSASSFIVGNPPSRAHDGSMGTRWTAQGSGSWITFDLGSARMINGVSIAFFNGDQRQAGLRLATSNNGMSFTIDPPTHVSSGTSTGFETFDLTAPTSARYLRIIGLGNTINNYNSYNEVRICPGANLSPSAILSLNPRQGPAPLGITLDGNASFDPDGSIASWVWNFGDQTTGQGSATVHTYIHPGDYEVQLQVSDSVGAQASTTGWVTAQADLHAGCDLPPQTISASQSDSSHPASQATDDNPATWWQTSTTGAVLDADLGSAQTVNLLRIAAPPGSSTRAFFDIETSLDNSNWQVVRQSARFSGRDLGIEEFGFNPVSARYVRIRATDASLQVAELQIWVTSCTPILIEEPWQIFPGLIELAWQSEVGRSYTLEYKDDINAPSWTAIGPVSATGTRTTLRDTTIGNRAHRLYRVGRLP